MSIIGQIGQFMIDNQELIGTAVLIAFAVLLVCLLISWIVRRHKKKKWKDTERVELLKKIEDLSTNNRVLVDALASMADDESLALALKNLEMSGEAKRDVEEVSPENAEADQVAAAEIKQETEHVIEEAQKVEPALAYMSRDANVDKHGNVYTEEMLRNQIG